MLFFKLIACFYTNSRKREMCKVAIVSYWYGSNTRGTTSKTWSNRGGAERRKAQKKNIKARIPQRLHLKVHDSISILGDFIERQETRITNLIMESSLRHKKIRIPLGKNSINKHVIIQSESWMNENFPLPSLFSSFLFFSEGSGPRKPELPSSTYHIWPSWWQLKTIELYITTRQ